MKEGIHPAMKVIKVRCSCGHEIETLSTLAELHIDVCSHCHPFYTGKQKMIDTAGRVERFKKKYEKKATPVKKAPRTITIS